jgi:hypothetical protein
MLTKFMAVAFFCLGQECYFWASSETHASQSKCVAEALVVFQKMEKEGAQVKGTCVKVPVEV